jgi:hypothetical protein
MTLPFPAPFFDRYGKYLHARPHRLNVGSSSSFINFNCAGQINLCYDGNIGVMTATSAPLNIVGYFNGLSSPSGTEDSLGHFGKLRPSPTSDDFQVLVNC